MDKQLNKVSLFKWKGMAIQNDRKWLNTSIDSLKNDSCVSVSKQLIKDMKKIDERYKKQALDYFSKAIRVLRIL